MLPKSVHLSKSKEQQSNIFYSVTDGSTLRWNNATNGCHEVFLKPGY